MESSSTAPAFDKRYWNITEPIKLDGEHGPYYIAITGLNVEIREGLFYGDEKHQFLFSFESKRDDGVISYTILDASLKGYWRGRSPIIPADELATIQKNIEAFLKTRNSLFIEKPLGPTIKRVDVTFKWRLQ